MAEQLPDVSQVLAGEGRRAHSRRLVTWSVVAVLVVAVGAAGWWWYAGSASRIAARYATEPVTRADVHVAVVATGTIEPTGQADVSSTISGTIDTVDVDYNDHVSKGQILARLNMGDLQATLAHAMAMVESQQANRQVADANLADAQSALERARALSGGQSVSVREVELAASALKRAQANRALVDAQVRGAEADLQGARSDYAKACICSPIDGVVLAVNVDPGQTITSASLGQPLFSIAADLTSLDLLVDIDEADIGTVEQGDTASFTVEAWPDRQFAGVIRQIRYAPVIVDGVVSYRAALRVDNTGLPLRPGMTATAEIAVDEATNVLTVPNAALRFTPVATPAASGGLMQSMMPGSSAELSDKQTERSIWVQRDGKLVETRVTVGLTDGQRTEVVGSALAEGDAVVIGTVAR